MAGRQCRLQPIRNCGPSPRRQQRSDVWEFSSLSGFFPIRAMASNSECGVMTVKPQIDLEEHRLGALDGLRGLMSLWVVVGHVCGFSGLQSIPVLRSPHYAV